MRCESRHTFDVAREGYANLARKQLPGDTREMLQARRSFLEQGHYLPLSTHLDILVGKYLAERNNARILDIGCGEGYYTGRLQAHLSHAGQTVSCVGLDISKEAVRMAAKRYQQAFFLVASIKERLTFLDETFHCLLNIFAPRNASEFARVLAPGGSLIVVVPGEMHLEPLRTQLGLLKIEEHKVRHVLEQLAPYFILLESSSVQYSLALGKKEAEQIVMMTPNYWHQAAETRQKLEALEQVEACTEFVCLVLRRA